GDVLGYVPLDGLLCRLTPAALDRLGRSTDVAWICFFAPRLRVHPLLLAATSATELDVLLAPGAHVSAALDAWRRAGLVARSAGQLAGAPIARVTAPRSVLA